MARLLVVVAMHDNPATSWPGHPSSPLFGPRDDDKLCVMVRSYPRDESLGNRT
ncbi:hypothetical protein Plim_2574 [Planctopirus limnophila DSM 3776]|uniref:Uncharacterized protein n=1 Tax=Planctopirus limnophila (strain ATCC 43296 / DSM 3776 / IFAM 1008 / Mu 290) TaxID=521674 RepID=D5SQ24_PLAL2|nr:hypothetical protein Plim_2574 [Planctopirus limnophila DSM 3776]